MHPRVVLFVLRARVVGCAGAAAAVLWLAAAAQAQAPNLITNGSFEADTFEHWHGFVGPNRDDPGEADENPGITGWATVGEAAVFNQGLNPTVETDACCGTAPFTNNTPSPDGGNAAFLQENSTQFTTAGFQQFVTLAPGDPYR